MATSPGGERIHALVRTQIKPLQIKAETAYNELMPRLKTERGKLEAAIARNEPADIELQQRAMTALNGRAATLLSALTGLAEKIKKLEEDDDFVDDQKEIEALSTAVSTMRRLLQAAYDAGKKQEAAADQALVKAQGADAKVNALLAAKEAELRELVNSEKANAAAMQTLVTAAEAAVQNRDARSLQSSIDAAQKIRQSHAKADPQADLKKFLDGIDPKKLSPDLQAELTRQTKTLTALMESFYSVHVLQVTQPYAKIINSKINPIDARKAADLLGLPPDVKGKLAAALSGNLATMTRQLDVLGKELKPRQSGRDMVEKLRKGKLW